MAIAAPSFHLPSETFIRTHVRELEPGSTVLICEDGDGADKLACAVLSKVATWRPPVGLFARLVNFSRRHWRKHIDPTLSQDDEERVVEFLRTHDVRALLVEYLNFGVMFMKAAKAANVPLIVHAHGYDASILIRDAHWRRHYRRLFKAARTIVVPSEFLGSNLRRIGCPETKIRVVPCGCDTNAFAPSMRIPNLVLAVGRLVEKKGPEITLRAFAMVARSNPDARLVMIGDGPLTERCNQVIRELDLSARVEMQGARNQDEVRAQMMRASVFVQHSLTAPNGDSEGLPVAILEAMSCALPVVSTRHSGIPEAVLHKDTGLLVEEHDVEAMAREIAYCLEHPDDARAMGEAGRRRVIEKFSIDRARNSLRALLGCDGERHAAT